MVFTEKLCRTSYALGPRSRTNGSALVKWLVVFSASTIPCVSSSAFDNVYELWNWMPSLSRLRTWSCRPWYQELESLTRKFELAQLRLIRGSLPSQHLSPSGLNAGAVPVLRHTRFPRASTDGVPAGIVGFASTRRYRLRPRVYVYATVAAMFHGSSRSTDRFAWTLCG